MEFNRSKRPTSNQRKPSDLEADINHAFPEHYMPFDAVTNISVHSLLISMMH